MWTEGLTTRYLFFTGKGGVGKTSLASATALHLAQSGKRTLIVSTDPASNLDEVFGCRLASVPTPIASVPNLWGANLDPEAAAMAYREKVVGPFRGKLPQAVIRNMEEQFSGACTTEIAAFDEFVRLMSDDKTGEAFDHIVFDTAPTGHTLRLLSLPSAWSGYLNTTTAESSCLGPLAGLQDQRHRYEVALERLSNKSQTTVVLVARAETSSLREAARTQAELADLSMSNLRLIVNGVFHASDSTDPIAVGFSAGVDQALQSMPPSLADLPIHQVPLIGGNVVGIDALRALLDPKTAAPEVAVDPLRDFGMEFDAFVEELARPGHGVIMTMGKGGVGKTTVAVRIAQSLADLGYPVLLTTTDPAGNVLDLAAEHPQMQVASIDPAREVERYTQATLDRASESMDEEALALLREDLRSPCTEEIAVFRAFAETVAEGKDRFVVIDTAPTGHTILLMDATEAYHREVARTQSDAPESVRELLPHLRDPQFTRVVLVALPEPTPVHEAMKLRGDLARAGISTFGWVVNRSLARAGVRNPILSGKAAHEATSIQEVAAIGEPWVLLPWQSQVLSPAIPLTYTR